MKVFESLYDFLDKYLIYNRDFYFDPEIELGVMCLVSKLQIGWIDTDWGKKYKIVKANNFDFNVFNEIVEIDSIIYKVKQNYGLYLEPI